MLSRPIPLEDFLSGAYHFSVKQFLYPERLWRSLVIRRGAALGFLLILLACGEDPNRILTRVRYLQGKEQYKEALDAALNGADHTRGKDRAEILLKAAETAFALDAKTGKKGYALQAIQILKTIMDERKMIDGRPQDLAAKIFEAHGKIDKASKYLLLAEKMAGQENKDLAGNYRIDLIQLYRKSASLQQAIDEANVFMSTYPRHPRRAELETQLHQMEAERDAEWNAEHSSDATSSR